MLLYAVPLTNARTRRAFDWMLFRHKILDNDLQRSSGEDCTLSPTTSKRHKRSSRVGARGRLGSPDNRSVEADKNISLTLQSKTGTARSRFRVLEGGIIL